MNLKVLVLALGMAFSASTYAKVNVEYRISRVHGLLDFAMAIARESHHAPGLSEIFLKSSFNNPENQKAIEELKSTQASFSKSFENESKAKRRASGQSVDRLILIQSIYAKDLKDLGIRSLGLMPIADHLKFFNALKKIEPVYNQLIWNPLSPGLKKHKTKLEVLAKKAKLNEMFEKAEKFYRTTWPPESPFVIALYPIPYLKDFKNSSSSSSMDSVEVHGVIVTDKEISSQDLIGSFGVIFHELCHSVYSGQPDSFKVEIEHYFLTHPSPYASQAYAWLNETLATAIGNGWAYARLNQGDLDKSTWYNNPTIDAYSHAIYPLIAEAFKNGTPMDTKLLGQFIEIYAKTFPDSIYSFSSLFSRLLIIHDGTGSKNDEIKKSFRERFTIFALNTSSPIDHQESIYDVKQAEEDSVLFVFSSKTQAQLNFAAKDISFLKQNLQEIQSMNNRNIFAALDGHGRAYVFIKVENAAELKDAITSIAQKQKIDPKNKVWSF